jgi:transposase InsO family protein
MGHREQNRPGPQKLQRTPIEVGTFYIEAGSPWENDYIECFNGKLRDELLNGEIFTSLLEAKVLVEQWRRHYNTVRSHSSIGYRPPARGAIQLPSMGAVAKLIKWYKHGGRSMTATAVREFLGGIKVCTLCIKPGSPWENGYIESFIGKLRNELLNGEIFTSLLEAKVQVE